MNFPENFNAKDENPGKSTLSVSSLAIEVDHSSSRTGTDSSHSSDATIVEINTSNNFSPLENSTIERSKLSNDVDEESNSSRRSPCIDGKFGYGSSSSTNESVEINAKYSTNEPKSLYVHFVQIESADPLLASAPQAPSGCPNFCSSPKHSANFPAEKAEFKNEPDNDSSRSETSSNSSNESTSPRSKSRYERSARLRNRLSDLAKFQDEISREEESFCMVDLGLKTKSQNMSQREEPIPPPLLDKCL